MSRQTKTGAVLLALVVACASGTAKGHPGHDIAAGDVKTLIGTWTGWLRTGPRLTLRVGRTTQGDAISGVICSEYADGMKRAVTFGSMKTEGFARPVLASGRMEVNTESGYVYGFRVPAEGEEWSTYSGGYEGTPGRESGQLRKTGEATCASVLSVQRDYAREARPETPASIIGTWHGRWPLSGTINEIGIGGVDAKGQVRGVFCEGIGKNTFRFWRLHDPRIAAKLVKEKFVDWRRQPSANGLHETVFYSLVQGERGGERHLTQIVQSRGHRTQALVMRPGTATTGCLRHISPTWGQG